MKHSKLLFRLCLLALFVVSIVVVLGAYTRLVHAGLGCPDWPTCYGHLWVPDTAQEIHAANNAFESTPVETDKTWPEQIHRIFASCLGLIVFAIFIVALKQRDASQSLPSVAGLLAVLVGATVLRALVGEELDALLMAVVAAYFINLARLSRGYTYSQGAPFKLAALLAGLVVLQGLFGMWTVTLKLWPQVVTVHLLGGFATLSLIWLMLQRVGALHWTLPAIQSAAVLRLRLMAMCALILVVVQVALGGWTSANYAALACPDFPLCQNQWWPKADISQGFNLFQHIGPNYLGGLLDNHARIAIHMAHRINAVALTLVLLILAYRLFALGFIQARNVALVLLLCVGMQVTLGVLNIVLALPLSIAVAHNAGGAILLLVVVLINHRVRTANTE